MLITVSGPPGSGKSTTAAAMADALGYGHVSGGDIFRDMAAERDMTPVEFNHLAEEEPEIDFDLDRRQRDLAVERDDLVLESRLAGWMAGEHADLRIWLDAPETTRVERIASREGKSSDRAREETLSRAASEAKRYAEYYDIDIHDRSIYDLVVNTARWGESVVPDVILCAVESYDPAGDEGPIAIEGVSYGF